MELCVFFQVLNGSVDGRTLTKQRLLPDILRRTDRLLCRQPPEPFARAAQHLLYVLYATLLESFKRQRSPQLAPLPEIISRLWPYVQSDIILAGDMGMCGDNVPGREQHCS